MVAEARDRRAGSDTEARLDHAAEHHAQAERAGRVRHPDRFADPARLRELDVDPVASLRAGGDVGEGVAVLVDVDRERRARLELRAAGVACRERLLDVVDAERLQLRDRVERLVQSPILVDVDSDRLVPDGADRANTLDVEPVAAAELQLQALELMRLLGLARSLVRIAEAECPAGRRPCLPEPEEAPDREPRQLAAEVMQRRVDRSAGRELALGQARLDLLEGERIVSERVRDFLDVRESRLGRFLVAVDRVGLAVAALAARARSRPRRPRPQSSCRGRSRRAL